MIWTANWYAKQNITEMQLKTETIISKKVNVELTQIFFSVVSASWKNVCILTLMKDMMRLSKKVFIKEWKM